jgi:cyclopropane fatty-acyl-phospholipid synthase-like methyltransferase
VTYEPPPVDDRAIWDIWLSMHQLPAMAVADELGVFTALDQAPATAAELADRLGFDRRATDVLVAMLAALRLVAVRDGRHHLTDTTRTYLIPTSPYYWGPLLRRMGVLDVKHGNLVRALQAGTVTSAQSAVHEWERGEITLAQAEGISRVMHCHSLPAAVGLARSGALAGVTRLLDVGGGSGCYSIALAQHDRDVRCTVMELPAVCEAARAYIADGGVEDRVDTAAVDMFREPWPRGYDTIFLSNVFHDWSVTTNRALAGHAFDALPSNGRICLHEMLLAPDGSGPVTAASFSMLMLFGTKGRQYTFEELREILAAAGFVDVSSRATHGYYSVVTGRKP